MSTPTDRSMVQDSMKLLVPAYRGSGTGEEETSGGGTVESIVITINTKNPIIFIPNIIMPVISCTLDCVGYKLIDNWYIFLGGDKTTNVPSCELALDTESSCPRYVSIFR